MAYVLNGTNNYLQFAIGSALNGLNAGNVSVAVLGVLGDRNNGALVHFLPAGRASSYLFVETFASLNYGTGAIARNLTVGNVAVSGNYAVFGGSKASGGTSIPRGHQGDRGSALTHYSGATTLVDGTAVTTSDMMQVGQFQNSATEFANITVACIAVWRRVLSDAEWDSLSVVAGNPATYADWQALTPDTILRFDNIATLTDQAGGGTNETGRFGTTIVLGADPVGFFPPAGQADSDTATQSETAESIRLSHTDSVTLSEAQTIRGSDADSFTLSEAQALRTSSTDSGALSEAQAINASNTDSSTLSEANAATGTAASTDTGTLSEVQRISLSDGDGATMSDAGVRLGTADSDAALTSEAPAIRLLDTDVIVTSDSLFTIRLYDVDTGTLGESESYAVGGGMPTSFDVFTLFESERISLADSDSATQGEPLPTIRLNDSDAITFSELMRIGLSTADAAVLSESLNTLIGSVTHTDSLIVVEHESISGGDVPGVEMAPITIKIGVPHVTIVLTSPGITIQLE